MSIEKSLEELNRETRDIWNQNAEWWDEKTGEENISQKTLIGPATERLLQLREGELVLDVGCGNGAFSRRMAQLGGRVVAIDFSEKFLERARARTTEHADRIEYRLIDAADESQLMTLGERRFDVAVSTMAMMDMATIEPLMSALSKLLKPEGRFVFSVLHPCFNTGEIRKVVEQEDVEGGLRTTYFIKVWRYASLTTEKVLGIIGQPAPAYNFERTLSTLLNTCFRAGFAMDALEEPVFTGEVDEARPFSWVNFKEIPPFLIARLRLPT